MPLPYNDRVHFQDESVRHVSSFNLLEPKIDHQAINKRLLERLLISRTRLREGKGIKFCPCLKKRVNITFLEKYL